MSLILTCSQTIAHLTDWQERALPLLPSLQIRLHLALCPSCRAFRASLAQLPALVKPIALAPPEDLEAISQASLQAALGRLNRPPQHPTPSPIPEDLRRRLDNHPDRALRLQADVHQAFYQEGPIQDYPYLPSQVLAQLPPPESWTWQHQRGIRISTLLKDPTSGQRLHLMFAAPGVHVPSHTHLGTESILVLNGEMEDSGAYLTDGQWIFHGEGSSHDPLILEAGCWCLIREEGSVQPNQPSRWFQNLF